MARIVCKKETGDFKVPVISARVFLERKAIGYVVDGVFVSDIDMNRLLLEIDAELTDRSNTARLVCCKIEASDNILAIKESCLSSCRDFLSKMGCLDPRGVRNGIAGAIFINMSHRHICEIISNYREEIRSIGSRRISDTDEEHDDDKEDKGKAVALVLSKGGRPLGVITESALLVMEFRIHMASKTMGMSKSDAVKKFPVLVSPLGYRDIRGLPQWVVDKKSCIRSGHSGGKRYGVYMATKLGSSDLSNAMYCVIFSQSVR